MGGGGAVDTITRYYDWYGDFEPTLNVVSNRMESLGLVPAATVKVIMIFFLILKFIVVKNITWIIMIIISVIIIAKAMS